MNSCLQFSLNQLLSNVRAAGISRNAALSPVSFSAVAAMLGAGCSGRSVDQVLQFAGSKSVDELKTNFSKSMSILNRAKVSCINGVWIDQQTSFKPSYQQCLNYTFNAEAKVQDFVNKADDAVKEINSWAEHHTKGLIKSIIERGNIDHLTKVILGNALYFKGYWREAFSTEMTRHKDFYLENGKKISNVPFMTNSNETMYRHRSFGDYEVVEIPYKNSLAMQLVLPRERGGLKDVLEMLNADPELIDFKMESSTEFDEFWIPKFNFSHTLDRFTLGSFELGEMLQSEIGKPLDVEIIQKVRVEVDEKGTEAAAVTCGTLELRVSWYGMKKSFVADHPFLFIIKDKISGLVLFIGTVMNPLEADD